MTRDELVEKMLEAAVANGARLTPGSDSENRPQKAMAAALRVCVEEVLKPYDGNDTTYNSTRTEWPELMKVYDRLLENRRSRYLKPKSDPAVEAIEKVLRNRYPDCARAIEEIVAAVRKADREQANV